MDKRFSIKCFNCGAETIVSPPVGRTSADISKLHGLPLHKLYYDKLSYNNKNIVVIPYDYEGSVALECNKCGNIVADTMGG